MSVGRLELPTNGLKGGICELFLSLSLKIRIIINKIVKKIFYIFYKVDELFCICTIIAPITNTSINLSKLLFYNVVYLNSLHRIKIDSYCTSIIESKCKRKPLT